MAKDLTNVYKIDEENGIVKYTVKCKGFYFTGKAKVNKEDGDEFDIEKGKRIAKLRAILKMKKAQLVDLVEIQQWLNELLSNKEAIEEQIEVYKNSAKHIQEKLDKELGLS